jgi:phosphate transport system permease protein
MRLSTRKVIDRAFTSLGVFSILLLAAFLFVILGPILVRGAGAFVFRSTVDWRLMIAEKYGRGSVNAAKEEMAKAMEARQPVYDKLTTFENELAAKEEKLEDSWRRNWSSPEAEQAWKKREQQLEQYREWFDALRENVRTLLGPFPGEPEPPLDYDQYGQTRWDRVQHYVQFVVKRQAYEADPDDPRGYSREVFHSRAEDFKGTSLESLFPYVEEHLEEMMRPERVFYWGFLFDPSKDDAHYFGGVWPEILGTIYLTLGAMIFAVPMGVIAAAYLVEYAGDNKFISLIRTCISTLAGVPSIVFGLFGLAFFLNTLRVSNWFAEETGGPATKSVLAGSMTLALLVLPIVIRAAEEAIRAVPQAYREAALSLGASKWRTVVTVVLPAALPGILTGVVISMGRAAGETAPIMFTAAVSFMGGKALGLSQTLTDASPALPWNIYNLCAENREFAEIRHMQFGMVFTLVSLVLVLNATALIIRARVSKKLRG